MTKERATIDLPDVSSFEPRAKAPVTNRDEVKSAAESAGFHTRHAPQKHMTAGSGFDARTLRRSDRTAKLNIAIRPETRERFWSLAQQAHLSSGEDVLCVLMDAFEREKGRGGA